MCVWRTHKTYSPVTSSHLVSHVQQVSIHAVDGLADMLATSPVMTGSAAAVLLMALLVQRSRNRRAEDREV